MGNMSAAENLGYIPGLLPDLGQAPSYVSLRVLHASVSPSARWE